MLALGLPTGPITAVLMAALMIHGVSPGPMLANDILTCSGALSLDVCRQRMLSRLPPLVGLFVNVLRIPYAHRHPLVIMFCIIGV